MDEAEMQDQDHLAAADSSAGSGSVDSPAAILERALRWQAEDRERDRRWHEERARFDGEMRLIHMQAQLAAEQFGFAMLYLTFNPNPSPEGVAAIMGKKQPATEAG